LVRLEGMIWNRWEGWEVRLVEWVDYREVDQEGFVVEMGEGCLWVLIIRCLGRGLKAEMVDLLYLIETIGGGVEMGIYLQEVHHLELGSIRLDQRYVATLSANSKEEMETD